MKVLFISPIPYQPPWDEGVKNLTNRLSQFLQECGDDVRVVSPKGKDLLNALEKNTFRAWVDRIHYRLIFLRDLFQENQDFIPDVVFMFSSLSSTFGIKSILLRLIIKRPIIVYVTGLREPIMGFNIFSRNDNILVGSPYLNRYFPTAKVVPPFLHIEPSPIDFVDRHNRQHEVILYLGTLQPGRGVETLLEAINLAHKKRDMRLILACNGYGHFNDEWLDDTVDRLGIKSIVDIRGFVDTGEVYSSADVLVIPRESRQFMSFPLRIIEALNMGLPMIVTTMCDMDTLIEGAGIGIEPAQPVAMADAILKLLNDSQFYKQCVEGCQSLSGVYSSPASLSAIRKELLDAISN